MMLSGTRLKLIKNSIGGTTIPKGYRIIWGQISERIDPESGVKAQDATLYNRNGKPVAWYYGSTDKVRSIHCDLAKKIVDKFSDEELKEFFDSTGSNETD